MASLFLSEAVNIVGLRSAAGSAAGIETPRLAKRESIAVERRSMVISTITLCLKMFRNAAIGVVAGVRAISREVE